jgi:hypothetical protein
MISQLFINNEFVEAESGNRLEVINPATGDFICDVAEADKVSTVVCWIILLQNFISQYMGSFKLIMISN